MNGVPLLFIAFMIVNSNKQLSDTRHLGYQTAELTSHDDSESAAQDARRQIQTQSSSQVPGTTAAVMFENSESPTTASSGTIEQRCCSQDDDCQHANCNPQPLPVPVRDEGYYCPDKQRWLHQDTLTKGSTLEATSVRWEEGDMLVQCVPSVTDYNCIQVSFKSGSQPGVISLSGWSVCGGSSSASEGYVYEYFGLYRGVTGKWETFKDCNGTTVFTVGIDCLGPEVEKISPTVTAKDLMLCPLKVTGKHPLFHLSVRGCLMRQHGPVEKFTLPECIRGKETCLSDECWMNDADKFEPCMFYSNAGGYAPSAIYSQEGYPFPALADTGPLIGNNDEYFLEVDFPKIQSVSELKICGGSARGEMGMIKSFTLAYRDMYAQGRWTYVQDKDGELTYFEEKMSGGPSECSHPCPYTLEPPIITAGIRIYPQTWRYDKPYLRLDIKACQIHTCTSCDEEEAEEVDSSPGCGCMSLVDPLPADVNNALASEMEVVQPPDSMGVARVGPRDTQAKDER